MKADILSPSAMKQYLTCPLQYWHQREAGTTARPSYNWRVGSCFHQAMEVYVKSKYQMTFEAAMDWSIANIEAFSPDVRAEALIIGKRWLNSKNNPLPHPRKVIATEETFGPPGTKLWGKPVHAGVSFPSGLSIRGIIDLVWQDGNTIVIGDYKTTWLRMDNDDLPHDVQAIAYAVATKALTGRPVRVEFYMIRYPENGPVIWTPTEEEFESMENYLLAIQRKIRQDTEPDARPSLDCRYCAFNYACKSFETWASIKKPKVWNLRELTEILNLYDEWYDRHMASKTVKDDLKDLALGIMSREHIDRITLDSGAVFKIDRRATHTWAKEVQHIVNKYDGNLPPQLALELSQHKRIRYGKPYLRRTKRSNNHG